MAKPKRPSQAEMLRIARDKARPRDAVAKIQPVRPEPALNKET